MVWVWWDYVFSIFMISWVVGAQSMLGARGDLEEHLVVIVVV